MKQMLYVFALLFCVSNFIYGQQDLKELPDFNRILWVKDNSKIEKGAIYYKDKTKLNGYFVFESKMEDPEFMWVDSYRFGYNNNGKTQFKRINFSKIDSFSIGNFMYKFMDMKLKVGTFKITKRDLIYRVIKDYKKSTYLLQFFPEVLYEDPNSVFPNYVIHNKVTNEFFQPNLYSDDFDSQIGKFLSNCSEVKTHIDKKSNSNSLSDRINQRMQNKDVVIDEYLTIYDSCKITSNNKK